MFTLKGKYGSYECVIEKSKYHLGGLYVYATDNFRLPVAVLSVYISGISENLKDNEFCFKNYSENEGFLESMIKAKLVEHTNTFVTTGYVRVPIVRCLF